MEAYQKDGRKRVAITGEGVIALFTPHSGGRYYYHNSSRHVHCIYTTLLMLHPYQYMWKNNQYKFFFKRNLGCPVILTPFDNYLYIARAKRFVLTIDFAAGRHLEMWRMCSVVPVSILDKNNSNERVGVWHCNATTSNLKWRPAGISMIKTNHLVWIKYKELSNFSCWCRHKLRKTWDWYCWTTEVPFKKISITCSD